MGLELLDTTGPSLPARRHCQSGPSPKSTCPLLCDSRNIVAVPPTIIATAIIANVRQFTAACVSWRPLLAASCVVPLRSIAAPPRCARCSPSQPRFLLLRSARPVRESSKRGSLPEWVGLSLPFPRCAIAVVGNCFRRVCVRVSQIVKLTLQLCVPLRRGPSCMAGNVGRGQTLWLSIHPAL
jgi:hypothetical protein